MGLEQKRYTDRKYASYINQLEVCFLNYGTNCLSIDRPLNL